MLKEEIKKLIDGDVTDSQEFLEKYSHDYSIFEVKPTLIVFPRHAEDIKRIVRYVNQKRAEGNMNLSITVRAAGTCMSGGSLNNSIIVDVTKYMFGVKKVQKGNFGKQKVNNGQFYDISGKVSVLPGTFYRDFEKVTKKQGLIMPCYPASKNLCAVGGMVANNGAGEKSLKYGQNKDFVESLSVILNDGEEYAIKPLTKKELESVLLEDTPLASMYQKIWSLIKRNIDELKEAKPKTTKNSSGYLLWDVWNPNTEIFDPTKLFVGAQGTTGIITEITYKLVKVESKSKLLVVFLKNLKDVPALTHELLKSDIETLEVYDDHTLKFAVKFFRSFLKDKGITGILRYAWRFLPEFWMVLTGGMPKLIVLAEFVSNSEDEISQEAEMTQRRIQKFGLKTHITKSDAERDKYLNVRRDSFKLLSDHSKKTKTAPFIDDVTIPVDNLPEYLPELIKILEENKLLYTIAGHLGDGNLHVIPLMDFNDPKTDDTILDVSSKVYEFVKKYDGSMTAEHNDGWIRTPYLEQMFGENIVGIFKEMKDIMDPKNMFNPKKKVGATIEDIKKYIQKPM